MMSELFDEEVLRKQYNIAERRIAFNRGRNEGKAEGRIEGRAEGRIEGRAEMLKEIIDNLISNGMDEASARKFIGLM